MLALAPSSAVAAAPRTPVVSFPGDGTTVLRVTVHNQSGVNSSPRSGSFEDGIRTNVGSTLVEHYLGFVRLGDRKHFPNVDVSAEKGSGLPTPVGIVLPN